MSNSVGYTLKEDDIELLCLLEECHDIASDKYHIEAGDFVDYMLNELEDLVKTHMVPEQFQVYV